MSQQNRGACYCHDPLPGIPPSGTEQNFLVVDTIEDLREYSVARVANGQAILVKGYWEADGDGGGFFFYDRSSSDADNGGTIIAPESNRGRWLRPKNSIFYTVQFGAIGNFDDATDAIQRTITAAEAFSVSIGDKGVQIFTPPGQFVLTETLLITRRSVSFIGSDVASTGFFRSGDYGPTFELSAQTGVSLSDFYCYTYGNTTQDAHIFVNGTTFCRFSNLFLRRQYGGIEFSGGGGELVDVTIETGAAFTANQPGSFGFKLRYNTTLGSAPITNSVRLSVAAVADSGQSYPTTFFPPEYGIQILACDSAYFTSCYSGNSRVNVHIKSTNGYQNTDQAFSNCFLDGFFAGGPTEYGLLIEDDAVVNTAFGVTRFDSCFFGGQHYRPGTTNTGRGIYGSSTQLNRLAITGCHFNSIGKEAINLTGMRNVSVVGGSQTNINKSNTSSVATVFAGASRQVAVNGVTFGDSADSFAMAAACLFSGTTDVASFVGNAIRATSDNPVLVTTTGINIVVQDNATENNPQLASTAALAIPAQNDFFVVTGTTNITSMTGGWNKRHITLRFLGILTVTDGSNLVLAGNFVTAANSILRLVSDGTNWYEESRSTN